MKILVIEDDAQLQRFYQRFLRHLFQTTDIVVVDTASDAIFLLGTHEYDLVISDYNLADGSNGGQVLEWIRVNDTDLLDHYIMVSANDEAQKLNPPKLLAKPCTTEELREALHAFL